MNDTALLATLISIAIFGGVLLGATLTWLLVSRQVKANAASAETAATAPLKEQLASTVERVRALQAANEQLLKSISAIENQQLQSRQALAATAQENATLKERTARVAVLESEVTRVSELALSLGKQNASLEEQVLTGKGVAAQLQEVEVRLRGLAEQHSALRSDSAAERERLGAELSAATAEGQRLQKENATLSMQLSTTRDELATLRQRLGEQQIKVDAERESAESKLRLVVGARDELTNQFKTLAAEILEDKSRRFTDQNKTALDQLLGPLRTKLVEFQGKIEEVYFQEGKDRSALAAQVRQLAELNQTISQDAKNLTHALKGSAKAQGAWGEMILERVLEQSGLRKGVEYIVQDSQLRDDGSRQQADVVINLPEGRKLVVDSKVSLVAYERYASSTSDEERSVEIRRHLDSLRGHIKALSAKEYHANYGAQTLDFVLAFVPIEPAFMAAVTHDNDLFMDAYRRNVLLVSPSTLLFVLRTVAHLWRQEAQSRNAQEIAKRGGELYDKLCGFVTDLQNVGARLQQAKDAYDNAHAKLATGKGNVLRRAEGLKSLGVKPSKALPLQLVDFDEELDESEGAIPSAVLPLADFPDDGQLSGET